MTITIANTYILLSSDEIIALCRQV